MRLINEQDVFDIIDDLRDQMTVEGYWSVIERVKALPSARPVDKDIDVPSNDCISRQMLLEYIHGEPVGKLLCDKYNLDGLIEQFPSAQPEHTKMIKEIRKWINSGNRGSADYFIVDKIEEIINKYE